MDFKGFVDMIDVMTCVISVETKEDGSYGDIRIVTGNAPYIASIESLDGMVPEMLSTKFEPNCLYERYIPKDMNFEDFCYRCAVLKQPMHTYVHPERYDFWFNLTMIPLMSVGNIHYCTYSQLITKNADSEEMSNTSASTASAVLNTCIKLRGATNFTQTMNEVISDIRKICDAQSCVLLLTDNEKRVCSVLAESRNEYSVLPSMHGVLRENFYELTTTWKDTIGGSNCLIIKNANDWKYLEDRNPVWFKSLTEKGVESLVLFPLEANGETMGYIWVCNFDVNNVVKIKETIELTVYFLAAELANHRLLERLKVLSSIDMLTGVLNRNEMNNRVDTLRTGSEPALQGVGIVFADLNGLKPVNDTEGHNAGDCMLKEAAFILKSTFEGCEIYRAGGDEFVILAMDKPKKDLEKLVEKIRNDSTDPENVSFAIGFYFDDKGGDIRVAMREADANMYEDKKRFYERFPEMRKR